MVARYSLEWMQGPGSNPRCYSEPTLCWESNAGFVAQGSSPLSLWVDCIFFGGQSCTSTQVAAVQCREEDIGRRCRICSLQLTGHAEALQVQGIEGGPRSQRPTPEFEPLNLIGFQLFALSSLRKKVGRMKESAGRSHNSGTHTSVISTGSSCGSCLDVI